VRKIAGWLLVLGVCAAALALGATNDKGAEGKSYEIAFDNAFGLTEGGDFKIAGVRAGRTTDFRIEGQARPVAIIKAEITEPGFADLREDAHCEVKPQSLIGEYYVDCQPGTSKRRIPDGGRVPVERTSSTIPIDLLNDVLRRPYRDRLRLIVNELGAGLAGRPQDLNEVLRRAHPGLRETSQTLRILGRQTDTIQRFVGDAETVVGALERRKEDVSRFVREAGRTAEISASRRDDLARSFNRLPDFLAELQPYMGRLGELADAQVPVLNNLRSASGDLDTFLTRLQPFSEAGKPALNELGDASAVGRRAVRKTTPHVEELRKLAADAPGLAKPLRQLLETSDDRRRAAENDPRAAASGPPAGDKTHIPAGGRGGFTAMEAIWNYFFWQALSTNSLDNVGHVLRLSVLVNECSAYQVKPSRQLLDECNQWLGPYQPGVTDPDPTRTAVPASSTASTEQRTAGRRREGADTPLGGNTPAPVQNLPPSIQDLLGGVLGQAPSVQAPAPAPAPQTQAPDSAPDRPLGDLLDYLLTP
jgi:virulence factor Mce-like protein